MFERKILVYQLFAVILYYTTFTVEYIQGQSLPTLSELLTSDGFPAMQLQLSSSIPTSDVFQWIFPSLSFDAGLNITGWLFQAEISLDQQDLILGMDDKAPLFTLWDRFDDTQSSDTDVSSVFTRCKLNSTRALFIHKITGITPSVYYYELEEAVETRDRDAFGIRGTNEMLGIHFMNISIGSESIGWRIEGDDTTFKRANGPSAPLLNQGTSFPYLPLVTPVFGGSLENITDQIHNILNVSKTTTTSSIPTLSLNTPSSNTRWIIIGAAVGLTLALGAIITITTIATVVLTHGRRRREESRKMKKWQPSNTISGDTAQYNAEMDSSLSAKYHLHVVNDAAADNLWQVVSVKEKDTQQGTQTIHNKASSETADCATIQLTQNAAYHSWSGKHNNIRSTTGNLDSGHVNLDPPATDRQKGGYSIQYSDSAIDDYDYI